MQLSSSQLARLNADQRGAEQMSAVGFASTLQNVLRLKSPRYATEYEVVQTGNSAVIYIHQSIVRDIISQLTVPAFFMLA